MTLGNMRDLGVKRLIPSCLNYACRHTGLIEVWSYPAETEIPYFKSCVVCAQCGGRGNKIDVRMRRMLRRFRRRRPILSDAVLAIGFAIVVVIVGHWIIGW
jgi:hypothetical protein